jgi:hypothetical protein
MGTAKNLNKKNVDQLNSFLRGEISAVETYRLALDKLEAGSDARPQLQNCMTSHQERVRILTSKVIELGGTPSDGSGAWGAFAKVVEGSASVLGDKVAIDALEAGEDHGLKDYRTDASKVDPSVRQIIMADLLPKQETTHRTMSTLKHSFH